MRRRTILSMLAGLGLAACGFQPRGMVKLPPAMQRVHLGGRPIDPAFSTAFARLLRQNGGELVSDAGRASLRLRIIDYAPSRRQVVIDPRARLREVELGLSLTLEAEDDQGRLLLDERFEAVRMLHYDPNNLLAAGEEEARLRADLQESLAQAILARLRAVAGR